ncbi:ABC transporter substrate-binding protein [Kaistia dalseonensis]|uniref:ABC transporter substrate-binding protein n=1 Tax=Kaistia dalseonensis TaxID=410840 RepID=UPI00224D8916|nr:ABC transporter substrate-binding protein [Kaistia dalseonensis]MCX5496628.1 ABC transporter substrate-binding protein [Kaistia dalseonensis]
MTLIRNLLSGVVFAAMAALPAVAASASEVTIAIGSEPSTLDPQQRDDGGERAINDNIYETLMARTPAGELVPGLAAAAPTQIDATTWEFKLRPGVTFTNGEPFNADAVVASVTRIIDPALKSEQMSYFGTIKSAEKVDDVTVRIITTGADPILPSRMYWMKMVPAAYSKDPNFATAPVGTGPYELDSWSRGESVVLKANPKYWGGAPAIDQVNYRFISEPGTRMSGLMAGELDVITNLLPEFVASVPKSEAVQGLETSVIILSTENPTVKDLKVREALNLAVDRKALAESLFSGYATPTKGQLVNPRAFGYNKALEPYPYDPEKARALIKEAGAEGKTITLVGEAGRWLKDRELIEAVGAYWDAVGVKTDIQINEFGEYLNQLFDKAKRPDAIFVVNSNELLDADRETSFAYQAGGTATSNTDKELAEWVIAARTETDVAKRQALYDEVTKKAHDNYYLVPLLNQQDIYGFSKRLDWKPRVDSKLLVKEMKVTEE